MEGITQKGHLSFLWGSCQSHSVALLRVSWEVPLRRAPPGLLLAESCGLRTETQILASLSVWAPPGTWLLGTSADCGMRAPSLAAFVRFPHWEGCLLENPGLHTGGTVVGEDMGLGSGKPSWNWLFQLPYTDHFFPFFFSLKRSKLAKARILLEQM